MRNILAIVSLSMTLVLATTSGAETLKVGGNGAALGTMRMLGEAYTSLHKGVTIEVPQSLGSGGGVRAMLAGVLDIAITSRALKEKEVAGGARAVPYAKTPLILITRGNHASAGVTSKELVAYFSGARRTWDDGTYVKLILRSKRDTDTKVLENAFAGMKAAMAAARSNPGIPVAPTDQDALAMGESVPGSLTTSTLTAIVTGESLVTALSIDGIAPTVENLNNGSYGLSKTLYIVTKAEVSPIAQDFIRFALSPQGAAILEATGNVALASDS